MLKSCFSSLLMNEITTAVEVAHMYDTQHYLLDILTA